jgi:hypothetical protein
LISYQIVSAERFEIEECSTWTSALGSIKIDAAFNNLILWLGRSAPYLLQERFRNEALARFRSLKVEFNPLDPECPEDFVIPIPRSVPDCESIRLSRGYLSLSKLSH